MEQKDDCIEVNQDHYVDNLEVDMSVVEGLKAEETLDDRGQT